MFLCRSYFRCALYSALLKSRSLIHRPPRASLWYEKTGKIIYSFRGCFSNQIEALVLATVFHFTFQYLNFRIDAQVLVISPCPYGQDFKSTIFLQKKLKTSRVFFCSFLSMAHLPVSDSGPNTRRPVFRSVHPV